jgi:hypothetical protein
MTSIAHIITYTIVTVAVVVTAAPFEQFDVKESVAFVVRTLILATLVADD